MADGTVQVSGVEAGGSATLINGNDQPFNAGNVRFLTRVHLGNGDDILNIDSEVEADTSASASANTSANAFGPMPGSLGDRLGNLLNGVGRHFEFARHQLLINPGPGEDTVNATVDADVDVHLAGNVRGDMISIETSAGVDASVDTSLVDANIDIDAGVNADPIANLVTDASANLNAGIGAASTADRNGITGALNTDLNAVIDAAQQLTAGGIGMNTDLDTALTANLALSPVLNSASNLGTSSLLNTDQNLNGSIGGSAALNLAGDALFDEIGLFNNSSLANMNADLAAQLALANAHNFGLTANDVDDFFAGLDAQNDISAAASAQLDADLRSTLGAFDTAATGSLNTNVNAGLNSAFQSRLGVPLG